MLNGRMADYPLLKKRLLVQQEMIDKKKRRGSGFENLSLFHGWLRQGLKVLGLEKRGRQNVVDFKIIERELPLGNVGQFWHGKRILHLSDTHLDGIPELLDRLLQELPKLTYDLCILTGDFRFGKGAYHPTSMVPTSEMLSVIQAPLGTYAVLGNHDFIEQVDDLEKCGVQVLMNESVDLGHNLYLAGVDDPHMYCCDDLQAALDGIPDSAVKILLAHSPEKVKEAAAVGVDVYLCGHTHGGQIGLPFVGAPFKNARCSRKFAFGEFEYRGMQGYTHRGTGASSVAARFNCPSEIIIYTLTVD
jgi:uncharacterized protein